MDNPKVKHDGMCDVALSAHGAGQFPLCEGSRRPCRFLYETPTKGSP